ncbi:MAG TPA: hypothetical protein VGD40_16010 [Chryseosolibacter sp.]
MVKRRKALYAIILIAITATALVVARSYLLQNVQDNLLDKIEQLNKSSLKIHYDTIYLDWKRNILTIEKLVVEKDAYDTTCLYPEFLSCQKLTVDGLGVLSLIFQNELHIDEVTLFKPHAVIHEKSELFLDSASRKETEFDVYIERITIDSLRMEMTDSAKCSLVTGLRSSGSLHDLNIAMRPDRPLDFSFSEIKTNGTRIDLPRSFYTFTIHQTNLNLHDHSFAMDTLRVIPSFNKLQFGRRAGNDVDRIEGVVPFLKISNLNLQYTDTVIVDAGNADIQFFFKLFHDKRLPHKQKVVPLPIAQLRLIPFGLSLNELKITKSYVEYEEVPANADEAGKVFFDNLEGTLSSITNDGANPNGEMVLKAKADFMGHAKLVVENHSPWNTRKNSTVKGSLSRLSFAKLNSMVEPAANIEFETGTLNRLDFAFQYNDRASSGEVAINYQDLKIVSYRTDEQIEKVGKKKRNQRKSEEELRKDNLKTFIINAFVVRKNMDESMPEEKRTGTISFERDRSRSVFNFWWKSLFTGIKSAFNLDKAEATVQKLKGNKKNK